MIIFQFMARAPVLLHSNSMDLVMYNTFVQTVSAFLQCKDTKSCHVFLFIFPLKIS